MLPDHPTGEFVGLVGQNAQLERPGRQSIEEFRNIPVGMRILMAVLTVFRSHGCNTRDKGRPIMAYLLGQSAPHQVFHSIPDEPAVCVLCVHGEAMVMEHPVHAVSQAGQGIEEGAVEVKKNSCHFHNANPSLDLNGADVDEV